MTLISQAQALCCHLALSVVVLSGPATAADPAPGEITLDDAIRCALKQNRSLEMARLAARQSDISVQDAENEFKINITPQASGSSAPGSSVMTYGLSVRRKIPLGTEVSVSGQSSTVNIEDGNDLHRDSVTVSLQQPLLRSAGLLVNREPIKLAQSRQTAAMREIELRKNDLVMSVAETYETLLKLQLQQTLEQLTISRLERLLKLAQARERQGRATRVDTLRSEKRLGDASLLLSRTKETLRSTRADFAELLALPATTELTAMTYPVPIVAVTNAEDAVKVALSNRLDYAQVLQDYDDAKRGIRIARNSLLPDVNLAVNYQKLGEGESGSAAARMDTDAWFVGLQVKSDLPMRSGMSAVNMASVGAEMAQVRIETFKNAIARQVVQAFADYECSKSEANTAEKNYRLAKRQADFARQMFERGKGDSFSASDAEEELQGAQAKWLGAQTAASVTAYRLLRMTGTLLESPQTLKPPAEQPASVSPVKETSTR